MSVPNDLTAKQPASIGRLEDTDLSEMHIAATHAHMAGFTRVQVDPLHAIEIIDRLRAAEKLSREQAYALVERELRERRVDTIHVRDGIICTVRRGDNDPVAQTRAPAPSLRMSVDLIGAPP